MNFEFIDNIYVEEEDIEEMCELVKKGMLIDEAINEVACGWDDCDYYRLDFIIDNLADEIQWRLDVDKVKKI